MEQLQNLVTQYALGLRRLEQEEEEAEEQRKAAGEQVGDLVEDAAARKSRARRVLLRLQNSADRSKWISSTEAALYVHTEQQHWSSHNEVPLFSSRPFFLMCECKRHLASGTKVLTKTVPYTQFSQVTFERKQASMPSDASAATWTRGEPNKPRAITNIGNTCYMNSLLQCWRQMLARIPQERLPRSDDCPLAAPLRNCACSR